MTGKIFTMAALGALGALAAAASPAAAQWNGSVVDTQSLRAEIDAGVARGDISSEEAYSLRSQLRGLINLQRQYEQDGLSRSERDDLQQRALGLRNEIQGTEGSASGYGAYGDNGYNRSYNQGYGGYNNGYGRSGNGAYGGAYNNGSGYGAPSYGNGSYGNGAYGSGTYGSGTYRNGTYGNGTYGNGTYGSGTYRNGTYDSRAYGNGQYDRGDDYRDDGRYDRNDGRYDRDDSYDRDDEGDALRVGERASGGLFAVPDAYRYRFRDGGGVYYRYGNGNVYQIDARTGTVLRIYSVGR
jgi:hypothetical protein